MSERPQLSGTDMPVFGPTVRGRLAAVTADHIYYVQDGRMYRATHAEARIFNKYEWSAHRLDILTWEYIDPAKVQDV